MHTRRPALSRALRLAAAALILASTSGLAESYAEPRLVPQLCQATVAHVIFSPDGRSLLCLGDRKSVLWDLSSGRQAATLCSISTDWEHAPLAAAFDRNGRAIVLDMMSRSISGSTLLFRDVATGSAVATAKIEGSEIPSNAGMRPDCGAIINGQKQILRSPDWKARGFGQAGGKEYASAGDFSPDGSLATAYTDSEAWIIDVAKGAILRKLGAGKAAGKPAWSADGKLVATVSEKGVILWDAAKGKKQKQLAAKISNGGNRKPLAISRDARLVAFCQEWGAASVWDVDANKELLKIPCGCDVASLAFSPDGSKLAIGLAPDEHHPLPFALRLVDLGTGAELLAFRQPPRLLQLSVTNPDAFELLGPKGSVIDIARAPLAPANLTPGKGNATCSALSHDGGLAAVGSSEDGVWIFDAKTWKADRVLPAKRDSPARVLFSPNDCSLAVQYNYSNAIELWDTRTWKQMLRFTENPVDFAFSPEGALLATCRVLIDNGSSQVTIYWTEDGSTAKYFPINQLDPRSIAVAPDGKSVAVGSADGSIASWDIATGKRTGTLVEGGPAPLSLAYDSSGCLYARGADDLVRAYRGTGSEPVAIFLAAAEPRAGLCFAPDGRYAGDAKLAAVALALIEGNEAKDIGREASRPDIIAARIRGSGLSLAAAPAGGAAKTASDYKGYMDLYRSALLEADQASAAGYAERAAALAKGSDKARYAIAIASAARSWLNAVPQKADRAAELAAQALTAAKESGSDAASALAALAAAESSFASGDRSGLVGRLEPARIAAERSGDCSVQTELYRSLGVLSYLGGDRAGYGAYFDKALAAARKGGLRYEAGEALYLRAQLAFAQGDLAGGFQFGKAAADEFAAAKAMADRFDCLSKMALEAEGAGDRGAALDYAKKARDAGNEDKNPVRVAYASQIAGRVLSDMGAYAEARYYADESATKAKEAGDELLSGRAIKLIGDIAQDEGKYDQALARYADASAAFRKAGSEEDLAQVEAATGVALGQPSVGKFEAGVPHLLKARDWAAANGKPALLAQAEYGLGFQYFFLKRFPDATKSLDAAAVDYGKLGDTKMQAAVYSARGMLAYARGDWAAVESSFENNVDLLSKVRAGLPEDKRRDFFAGECFGYSFLIDAAFRSGDFARSWGYAEASSANVLYEKVSGKAAPTAADRSAGIKRALAALPADSLTLYYANPGDRSTVLAFAIKGTGFAAKESANIDGLVQRFAKQCASASGPGTRGLKVSPSASASAVAAPDMGVAASVGKEGGFDRLIAYYRLLLAKPDRSAAEDKDRAEISRALYDLLVAPFSDRLRGATRLIVVPSGSLAYLPFETLAGPDGRLLAETFDVGYVQSLSVLGGLVARNYGEDRKSVLALGGAPYAGTRESAPKGADPETVVRDAIEAKGKDMRPAYSALGISAWGEIPATSVEAKNLAGNLGGTALLGADASESKIRSLSTSGELAKYRFLHFASHGFALSEWPELSALVLSQASPAKDGDDGYLSVREVEGLKLAADCVVLSACETGLGKIYGSEGVGGLAQAFLSAGANAVEVSLWQVADESTAAFMQAAYGLVKDKGMGFEAAAAQVKRDFASGKLGNGKWKDPYYWAPFVYYGK
jgi:CHAT domain-containing protein/WD40 repeat protein